MGLDEQIVLRTMADLTTSTAAMWLDNVRCNVVLTTGAINIVDNPESSFLLQTSTVASNFFSWLFGCCRRKTHRFA